MICGSADPYQDDDLIDVIFAKTKRFIAALPFNTVVSMNELNVLFFLLRFLSKKKLAVLDIGGACGAHYYSTRRFLPDSVDISWKVVETPRMAKKARELSTRELSFHDSIASAVGDERIDAILASGVIQYTPDPYVFLEEMMAVNAEIISIHRTPFFENREGVFIQRSALAENGIGSLPEGFANREVRYPITIMNKARFEKILSRSYDLLARWDCTQSDGKIVFSSCYKRREKNPAAV